ncbi:MAG: hypothetical protein WC464_06790 [Bdellovibrionales bacterium]
MRPFSSDITPGSLPSEEIIRSSIRRHEEFFLGCGGSTEVFGIDRYPNYVVRVPRDLDLSKISKFGTPKIIDDSKLEGKNFGQIVAEYDCGIAIALRQRGDPIGVPFGSDRRKSDDEAYAEKMKRVAAMPQEAYRQLVTEMKFLNNAGKRINVSNSNKLLFDVKGGKFNFVDIVDMGRNGKNNSPTEILSMLFNRAEEPKVERQGTDDK